MHASEVFKATRASRASIICIWLLYASAPPALRSASQLFNRSRSAAALQSMSLCSSLHPAICSLCSLKSSIETRRSRRTRPIFIQPGTVGTVFLANAPHRRILKDFGTDQVRFSWQCYSVMFWLPVLPREGCLRAPNSSGNAAKLRRVFYRSQGSLVQFVAA